MNHNEKVESFHTKLRELRDELRGHANQQDDPKCAALCETSSEVVGGLEEAFDHFINKSEKAWQ